MMHIYTPRHNKLNSANKIKFQCERYTNKYICDIYNQLNHGISKLIPLIEAWRVCRTKYGFLMHTSKFNEYCWHAVVTKLECARISLTRWGRDEMAAIFQTTFWNEFSWIEIYEYRLKFHWGLFLRVQFTISHVDSDNGLAPTRRQAIIWINDG